MLNEENVENFKKEIVDLKIYNKLDKTLGRGPNYNYKIVSTLLQHILNRIKNMAQVIKKKKYVCSLKNNSNHTFRL